MTLNSEIPARLEDSAGVYYETVTFARALTGIPHFCELTLGDLRRRFPAPDTPYPDRRDRPRAWGN